MIKDNLLLPMFGPVFSTLVFIAGLNELDLIKLKLPTKEELKGIIEGNSKMYSRYLVMCLIFMNHLTMEIF